MYQIINPFPVDEHHFTHCSGGGWNHLSNTITDGTISSPVLKKPKKQGDTTALGITLLKNHSFSSRAVGAYVAAGGRAAEATISPLSICTDIAILVEC